MTGSIRNYLILGLLVHCWSYLAAADYLPPDKDKTVDIQFPQTTGAHTQAPLLYHSKDIRIEGTARSIERGNVFEFSGTYRTKQPLERGLRLGFQVYSKDGELLLLDGGRSEFIETQEGKVATFSYSYPLKNLFVPSDCNEFLVKFNYVKEKEYWADIKHPELELPAFRFLNFNLGETFKTLFSYIPTIIPADRNIYSFHIYKSQKSKAKPFNHSTSIEARYADSNLFDDNKRYKIPDSEGSALNMLASKSRLPATGKVSIRLGYVWDKVAWYELPKDTHQVSHVLPLTLYLAICTVCVTMVLGLFYGSFRIPNRRIRLVGYAGCSIATAFLVLEFPTPLLPLIASILCIPILGKKLIKSQNGLYWTILAFTTLSEMFWVHVMETGPTYLSANAFSFLLNSIILSPLVFFKKGKRIQFLGNILLIVISAYYITTSLYYLFFKDYPTLNILTYATQGTDLTDSILSYLDSRIIVLVAIIGAFAFVINKHATQPFSSKGVAKAT